MKKKVFAVILALALVLGLAACGTPSSSAPPSQPAASAPPAQSTPAASAQPDVDPASITGEVTLWSAWTEEAGVGNWIAEFNKVYPNIKVTPVQYPNSVEGNLKMNTSLMAGDEVDVVINYNYSNYVKRAETGLFLDITDMAAADGIDFVAEWGTQLETNGRTYGLPYGGNTDKVFINLSMFEDAGIEVPDSWTLEEYVEIARKLTNGSGATKVYGCSDMHSGILYWSRMARGVLGSNYYYNEDGTSRLDNQAFADSLQFKYDMEVVEQIQYPMLEYMAANMQAPDAFLSGRTAMTVCTGMMARWIKDTENYPRDFKVGVMPMPSLYDGADNYNDGIYYFSFLGISAKTRYPEASYALAKWLATEGSAGLADVGHIPVWKSADKDAIIATMFGPNASELIDVEAVRNIFLNFEGKTYIDTIQTAYSEIDAIAQTEMQKVMTGEVSVEAALATMKEQADAAIAKAEAA